MNVTQQHETGYCVICGSRSLFRFVPTIITAQLQKAWEISDDLATAFNRKESMFCDHCGSSLRIRRLAAVLIETLSQTTSKPYKSFIELLKDEEFRRLKIAEINACGALHSYLKDHPNLYYSEWVPHGKPGEVRDGVRCEDLQCLTYPDNCFDIILTSETLEHVADPNRAWHEIYRTLKRGGCHIFTIPIIPCQWQTIQRAQFVDGARKNVLEPAYHGEWGREEVFVYTDFGMDVVEKLDKMSLSTKVFYFVPQVELDVAMVFRSLKNGGHIEVPAKAASQLLGWTGERYLPWLEEAAIGYEHLHRYAYATQFVHGKRVLDLACGEGYGSSLLAKTAELVVGIDIDEHAIKHARNKYIKQNLEFKVGSITEVPVGGEHLFDVAVCFEALEHVEDHHKLLSEVKRLLSPDGVFIVSTPNKTVYTDEPQYNNPFHVHELYFDEFRELLEKHFKSVRFLGQRIYCNSNIWPVFSGGDNKVVEYVMDRNPKEFVFVENDKRIPLYFLAIASDAERDIEETGSALIDVSDALLEQKDRQIEAHVREQERLGREVAQLQLTAQSQQQTLSGKDQQIVHLTAERDRFIQEVAHLQSTVRSQEESLTQKQKELTQLVAERERLGQEVAQVQLTVQSQKQALAGKDEQAAHLTSERERLGQEAIQLQTTLQGREQYIRAIEDSLAWVAITKYRLLRNKIVPEGSTRRKGYDSLKEQFRHLFRTQSDGAADNQHNDLALSGRTVPSIHDLTGGNHLDRKSDEFLRDQDVGKSILMLPEETIEAKLSVVIPTKNGVSEGFESSLQAIYGQKGLRELEVIVVDSGSVDGTVEIAESYGARVLTIPPEEFNHGATRDYAAEQSTGDILLFTVQDAIPATQDLFYEMAKALFAGPKLAGLGVRQVPRSDADIYACWEIWNHYRFLFEGPLPLVQSSKEIEKLSSQQLRRLAALDNVCSMVRRPVWEQIRFKPTAFGEDLEFGLSCVKQGYAIRLLSHRAVIHSHTRSPFYVMSRHYVDMIVLKKLFKTDSQPQWIEALNHDQLFCCVKALYAEINEFASRLSNSSLCNPVGVLTELVSSFVSEDGRKIPDQHGYGAESTLNKFFSELDCAFENDYPTNNPCKLAFLGTLESILQFLADRYPVLMTADVIAIMYKAFANVAGSILGEYCFWQNHQESKQSKLQLLDHLLSGRMRE